MRPRAAWAAACGLLLAAAWLAMPAVAIASSGVWQEGTASSPFNLSDAGGLLTLADGSGNLELTLQYVASTLYVGASNLETRSLLQSTDGSYLIAGGNAGYIQRVSSTGAPMETYDGNAVSGLLNPFDAVQLADGGTLIVDRGPQKSGQGHVFRTNSANHVTWSLDATSSTVSGDLSDPFTAEPLANGNILVADSLGDRVIEVDPSKKVVWSYGSYCKPGSSGGLIDRPHSAQRLDNGNTLICDSANNRIIEVTRGGQTAWSYNTVPGGSGGPNFARRLPSGNTLICDTENNRVLEVDRTGATVQAYGVPGRTPSGGGISDPRAALRLSDGTTLIADNLNHRIERYGYQTHHEYTVTSAPIDPQTGSTKWFTKLAVDTSVPAATLTSVEYSMDGSHWFSVPSNGSLGGDASGSAIRYRVHLSTQNAAVAPSVLGVSITWTTVAPSTGTSKSKPKSKSTTKKKTSTAASATKNSTSSGSSSSAGGSGTSSGKATASGSGSAESTTVAPGGTVPIAGGIAGDSGGGGGAGVQQSTTMSGWVMSEVKDDIGGPAGSSGTDGFGSGSTMRGSGGSAAALLVTAYTIGLAWVPASRFVVRFVTNVMPH